MDENIATEEHWDDQIFINRQREISKLSRNFTDAVDKLLAEKPIVVDIPEGVKGLPRGIKDFATEPGEN